MSTNSTSRHHRAAVSKTAIMPHTNRFIPHSPRISTSYGFIFLLNLTAADIVIHFDPWWNVAAQNQATDRAHRIGQENTVTVYELIAEHTIEEQIQKLQKTNRIWPKRFYPVKKHQQHPDRPG